MSLTPWLQPETFIFSINLKKNHIIGFLALPADLYQALLLDPLVDSRHSQLRFASPVPEFLKVLLATALEVSTIELIKLIAQINR